MIVLELLGRVLLPVLLLRADAGVTEVLLVAAVALLAVAVLAVLVVLGLDSVVAPPSGARFARLRPLLRASDPTAPGHRQARAPGATA